MIARKIAETDFRAGLIENKEDEKESKEEIKEKFINES
jgi:hypothetical protein